MLAILTDQLGNGNSAQTTFTRVITYPPSSMTVQYFKVFMNSTDLQVAIGVPSAGVYALTQPGYLTTGSQFNSNTNVLTLVFMTPPTNLQFISLVYQTNSQVLSFQYGGEGKSAYFNSILHKLLPMGVYSTETYSNYSYTYANATLVRVNDTTVSVSPFLALVRDVENDLSVRVEASNTTYVQVSSASPYVIARINWQNSINNYAEIVAVSYASILPDYIILGKCTFDINGYVTTVFDYTRRHHVDIEKSYLKQTVPFRVFATEAPSNTVVVKEGTVTFSTGNFTVANDTVTATITNTVAGRIDLVVVDQAGAVVVVNGIDNASPVVPSYDGKFVVAEIKRVGAWTTIQGQHIRQINPFRYFVTSTDHPTFNRVTLLLPPVDDSDAVRKDYVDNLVRGIDWQESVLNFINFVTSEPAVRTEADRYVATATGSSSITGQGILINHIYQWDSVQNSWDDIVPDNGTITLNENTGVQWLYNGAAWVQFSSTVQHNQLGGLNGGTTNEYYHLTSLQHTNVFFRNLHTTDDITEGASNKFYSDTLVNANAHVTSAYDHVSATGNVHSMTYADVTNFQTGVSLNTNVIAAKAHADITLGNPHNTSKSDVGLSNVDNVQQLPLAQKGAINGVATLDGSGIVTSSQLPTSVYQSMRYINTWNANTNSPTLPGTRTKGDYFVVSVDGTTTLGSYSVWRAGDWAVWNGTSWDRVKYRDEITSVNGYTAGAVVLTSSDVAEGSRLYYTEGRVTANTTVVSAYNHITADGSSHSLVPVIQASVTAMTFSGFISWNSTGTYYHITTSTFYLDIGGTGRIKGVLRTFAGSQSIALTAGLNVIYIDDTGTIQNTSSPDYIMYENNVVLFRVLYSATNTVVVKDTVPYKLNTTTATYIKNNIGSIIRGTGGNILAITTGTGTVVTDRQLAIDSNATIDHATLETSLAGSSGSPITCDSYYLNTTSDWTFLNSQNYLPMYYASSGTATAIPIANYAILTVYATQDDSIATEAGFIVVLDTNYYSTSGDAKNAIKDSQVQLATADMALMNLALLGHVIVCNNASGGFISQVFVKKATFTGSSAQTSGSDFISDNGVLTLIASSTEIGTTDADPYIVLRKLGTNAGYVKLLFNSTSQNLEITYG